jgi:hypothetical protein
MVALELPLAARLAAAVCEMVITSHLARKDWGQRHRRAQVSCNSCSNARIW